jgi:transcriptional regulator with XRE-family HTH domain
MNSSDFKKIHATYRGLRDEADMSQKELSFATGIKKDRIWRFENALTFPTRDERKALARALSVPVEAIPVEVQP